MWLAVYLLAVTGVLAHSQPDALGAITAIPPWCWLSAGVFLSAWGYRAAARWEQAVAVLTIVVFAAAEVEQTQSLARSIGDALLGRRSATAPPWRLVTINCDTGSRAALREALALHPDIVLVQESPNEAALAAEARAAFGSDAAWLWSSDCAIIARGTLHLSEPPTANFLNAIWKPNDELTLEVISLRLSPPVVRYDLWAPSCWAEHMAVRRRHATEAAQVEAVLGSTMVTSGTIVGGDCNEPAGSGALRSWRGALRDAFATAGRGWGGTVLNQWPMQRFDQVWCEAW